MGNLNKISPNRTDAGLVATAGIAMPFCLPEVHVMITGKQIRAARAAIGLTLRELAAECEIAYATLQRIESDDGIPNLSAKKLDKVIKILLGHGIVFLKHGDPSIGDGISFGIMKGPEP